MNEDFTIVDRLAHAYGWSIDYIEKLGIEEIQGLLNAINEREENDRKILSYIFLLAVNGKSIDSAITCSKTQVAEKKVTDEKILEDEKNIMRLFEGKIVDRISIPKGNKS